MDDEQIEVLEHLKYIGSLKSDDDNNCGKETRSRIRMANKNARSCTDLESQRNKQRSENETRTLAGVYSAHLWRRRRD